MAVQPPDIVMKDYKIVEIIKETPEVTTFRFGALDGYKLKFEPGMFVMITYVNTQTNEKVARAFSLAGLPGSDVLEFEISLIHGQFTSHLDNAKLGDLYKVTGPHGQFKFSPESDNKVLFIAGGTGLAPFMSMLREIRELDAKNDVILLYSVKYHDEIIRKQELEDISKQIKLNTTVTVTRPQEGDGWMGEKGHVDAEMIKRHVSDLQERAAYICGPLGFVKAIKEALAQLGVNPAKVKADVWG